MSDHPRSLSWVPATGVAAVKLGRKFIGIEDRAEYFDIACRRISRSSQTPDLFIERPAPIEQLSWNEMWNRPFDYPERL